MMDSDNMISVLDSFVLTDEDDVARMLADDFRNRRVEKDLSREMMAEISGVALANIVRFERKGLISLKNLILLAMALGYISEIRNIFSTPKFSTMEELQQIRRNTGKIKAYPKKKSDEENR